MNFELSLSQEQRQTISAAQIQALKLLAMDNLELRELMEAEYLENPLLEYDQKHASAPIENGYVDQEEKRRELPGQERTLQEYITSQLNIRKYTRREWKILKYLIDNLDENGYYTSGEAETAAHCGVPEETIHALLADLKKLEPRGLFARDLKECLLLQLYAQGIPDPLVKVLVCDHLEALSRGDVRAVAKALSLPVAVIRSALGQITRLNPRPLNGLDTSRTIYVVPDILLRYDKPSGAFQATLNDDWYNDYRISDYYLQIVRQTEDPQLREYFEQKYMKLKFLMESIQQRRETLLTISHFVSAVQREYLLGTGPKAPVTMTAAAQQLDMAVSTVSRAVKGKYIQVPSGCILLKSLFETPASRQSGEAGPSRDTVKEAIRQLIAQEDGRSPLSDADLVELLKQQGAAISRRTVAKYRESMGIRGCFDRRI